MAFDVSTRAFEVLLARPPCSHDNGRVPILELGGLVCVACSHQSSNAIVMWAMGDTGIWSVLHRVELATFSPGYSSGETTLLATDPKDGRILLSTGRALGYYDPQPASPETVYHLGVRPCEKIL